MGIGRVLQRTFFWAYERGSWQYDVAVGVILVFVLLTPSRWFRDQPEVGVPVTADQVEPISAPGQSETYRVDARVLPPPERTPALQNDLHNVMQRARPDLSDGHFSIGRIEAVRDEQGNVIAYKVEVHR
jgi:hypothetical protein